MTKNLRQLNPDYALGFRHESKRYNKDGCSKFFLTRKHSHHYGENQKVLMYPYLQ